MTDTRTRKAYNIAVVLILLLLMAERVYLFWELGFSYWSGADEVYYFPAGFYFAETGVLAYQGTYPTAMIMPAMPVIIGLLSMIIHQWIPLLMTMKVIWCAMGVLTAWYCCKTVNIFAPSWCGIVTMLSFFLPNMAWMNNVILTETPYMLFFTMCLYYTLQMGRSNERKYFIAYLLAFMAALMFRANILPMLAFTAVYVLIVRKDARWKEFYRRAVTAIVVLLLFIVPWTIRNYVHFDAFIPVTYGVGNPTMLGTYQGEGYPEDEELDYETNVDAVLRERFPQYFDEQGELTDQKYAQYMSLEADMIKAEYRLKVWFENDPVGLLKSYLLLKPRWILNWVWAWETVMGVSYETLNLISKLVFLIDAATVLLSLILKRFRKPVLFLTAIYWISIYTISLSFASDRYAATLVGIKFTLVGFGLLLLTELWQRWRRSTKNQAKNAGNG